MNSFHMSRELTPFSPSSVSPLSASSSLSFSPSFGGRRFSRRKRKGSKKRRSYKKKRSCKSKLRSSRRRRGGFLPEFMTNRCEDGSENTRPSDFVKTCCNYYQTWKPNRRSRCESAKAKINYESTKDYFKN